MTWYLTQSHYPDTEPISPCPILLKLSTMLGSDMDQFDKYKSLVWFNWESIWKACALHILRPGPVDVFYQNQTHHCLFSWQRAITSHTPSGSTSRSPAATLTTSHMCKHPHLQTSSHSSSHKPCSSLMCKHINLHTKLKFVLFNDASRTHWFSYHRLVDIKHMVIALEETHHRHIGYSLR